MAAGTFREDLFYRLAVFKILLPPLRDRQDDARLLAQFFLHRYSEQAGKPGLTFDPEATRAITSYSWPGNVRQLENCIRRAVIMSEGKRLTGRDLDLPSGSGDRGAVTLKDAREQLEREMISGLPPQAFRQNRPRRGGVGRQPPDSLRPHGQTRNRQRWKGSLNGSLALEKSGLLGRLALPLQVAKFGFWQLFYVFHGFCAQLLFSPSGARGRAFKWPACANFGPNQERSDSSRRR